VTYTEVTVPFECESEWLLGILAKPETPSAVGVVIIVGGPQYRAGSHRQFVMLARTLAQAGYAVLRIDYRGMGDSNGATADFTKVTADISAAIDALQLQLPMVKSVALWGLCDGASAALLYWLETRDPRVHGMCLLNPWVRTETSLARTQVKHYYTQRLMQREFWKKLVTGKVAASALAGLVSAVRRMRQDSKPPVGASLPFQQRMGIAWNQFTGSLLLILSDEDYTAKEFLEYAGSDPAWSAALVKPNLIRHDVKGADHTFSNLQHSRFVETFTENWLKSLSHKEVPGSAV
jgi:uncharacterized protein